MDNTLLNTSAISEIRESLDYDKLTPETLDQVKIYKPVKDFLDHLHSKKIPMAVVTNSGRIYAEKVLEHFDLKKYFSTVVTYGDVKITGIKPSPYGINLAIERLGLQKTDKIIYIGDEDKDVIAAYRANIIPALCSWGSRQAISTAPEIEISSIMLKDFIEKPEEYRLFADRSADHQSINYKRDKAYFLPLDEYGNVVTVTAQLKVFCLGRYFSKNTIATSIIHDNHSLSKEIAKKELSPTDYKVPPYWTDMLHSFLCHIHEFQNIHYDIITIIPAKKDKSKRLESLLVDIQKKGATELASIDFITDVFYFIDDAKSVKFLKSQERSIEVDRSLQLNKDISSSIQGKSVLIIDDVITTGSTFGKAFQLLETAGAKVVNGIAIAKTVTFYEDEKNCPKCGSKMFIRKNPRHDTLHYFCTGYRKDEILCKYIENVEKKPCPKCQRNMNIFRNKSDNSKFWSCSGYNQSPVCNYKEEYKKSIN